MHLFGATNSPAPHPAVPVRPLKRPVVPTLQRVAVNPKSVGPSRGPTSSVRTDVNRYRWNPPMTGSQAYQVLLTGSSQRAASHFAGAGVRHAAALIAVQQNGAQMTDDQDRFDALHKSRCEKTDQLIRMMQHLRDTRTSLRRAAKAAQVSRKQIRAVIYSDAENVSLAEMTRIADAICVLPYRQFGLVSYRLESWRTPTRVLRARDEKSRQALIRHYRKHPNEEGAADIVRFLELQQRRSSEAKTSGA